MISSFKQINKPTCGCGHFHLLSAAKETGESCGLCRQLPVAF
jgi:hypothetical protein